MYRFCTLLFGFCRLSRHSFEFLIAEARGLAAGEDQVGQVSQKNTLDGQSSNVVDERVQGNLSLS